ncbi:MAG: HAD-IA family hydrolase [Candidatus Rokubacteria bacterium]|nr:HAD-IA family hydrolase [Candidatus Rokubacteria bacterium]
MGLRAVFLDAGNTILALDYAVITERIRADGHPVTPARVRLAEQRARVRLDPHLAGTRSTETGDTFRFYFRYTLEDLGVPWDAAAERIADDLRRAKPPFGLWSVLVPEAPAVLDGLRRRGLRLAVVSNSNGTVAEILREVGLARHVDVVVDSGLVGVEKPDPRIFAHAADALRVRPEEAVHVGDLYSVDVAGARAAGCGAILLDPAGAWMGVDCPTAPDLPAAARLIETMA